MNNKLFDITTPAFGGKPVRTAEIGGETWFCAKDAFEALDMNRDGSNASNLAKKYNIVAAEVRVITKTQLNRTAGTISDSFPNRGLTFINATAVRRIAQRSNKPAARQFQFI